MERVHLYKCLCMHWPSCGNRSRLTRLVMTGPYEIALTLVFNSRHGASQPIMSLLDLISMRCTVTTKCHTPNKMAECFPIGRETSISSLLYVIHVWAEALFQESLLINVVAKFKFKHFLISCGKLHINIHYTQYTDDFTSFPQLIRCFCPINNNKNNVS